MGTNVQVGRRARNTRLAHRESNVSSEEVPNGKTAQPKGLFQRPSFCSQVACLLLPLLKHHKKASIEILRLYIYALLKPKSLKEGRWGQSQSNWSPSRMKWQTQAEWAAPLTFVGGLGDS